MSILFDDVVIDFLLSPPSQDEFKRFDLRKKLYSIRNNVHVDQIEDVMQIIWMVYDELWDLKEFKLHDIEDDCDKH